MKLVVNGKAAEFEKTLSIADLLDHYRLKRDQVVVELNLAVPEKGRYAEVMLKEGDRLEIVKFMGGG